MEPFVEPTVAFWEEPVTLDAVEQQALEQALCEELLIGETIPEPEPEGDIPVFEEREAIPLEEEPEDEHPFRGRGLQPSMPLMPSYIQPKLVEEIVQEKIQEAYPDVEFASTEIFENKPESVIEEEPILITRIAYPESNYNTSMDERPGDYVEPLTPISRETAPGRNRGIMHTHLVADADNVPTLGTAARSDFGNEFPANPTKGDTYLRTDFLPNRLFKFNDFKWIEVAKDNTDVYAYEEEYIKHLIEEIASGRYDPDSLTDIEREQIQQHLGRNA
jgi:hypothetical protein